MFSGTAFILWLILPILVWVFHKRIPFAGGNGCMLYIATIIAGSLLYVFAVSLVGAELEHDLNKFDLDGDRSFSKSEMTPEAEAAMRRWATDTGRTFAPIIAAPATFVWVSFWFLLLTAGKWVACKLIANSKKQAESGRRE